MFILPLNNRKNEEVLPALNSEKRTQAQVTDITKNGVGSIPGYGNKLSDMQIQAAAQYVANLK